MELILILKGKTVRPFMIFILMTVVFGTAQAVMVDVDRTAILVEDTVNDDPLKIKQAFAQILAINTGEDVFSILNHPVFVEANIVQGINRSYFEKIETKYLPENSSAKYWFHLIMKEEYIKSIIKQAQFSILPDNRKEMMLWLVQENEIEETAEITAVIDLESEQQQVLPLNYAYENEVLVYWIKRWAKALGLVVVFPDIDEIDMFEVTPESVKNLSYEAVEHSRNRYNLKNILMLYTKISDQALKLRSGLVFDQSELQIKHFQQHSDVGIGAVLYEFMSEVAFNYAQQYAISSSKLQNSTIILVVDDIQSYDEIMAFNQYIKDISVIESHNIVQANAGHLVVNINAIINREELQKMINTDGVFFAEIEGSISMLRLTLQR